jgi:hypothetical protein
LATVRGTEVVSDQTNVLALAAAKRRREDPAEAELLTSHLAFWVDALADLLPGAAKRLRFTSFGEPVLTERFRDTIQPALDPLPAHVTVVEDPARTKSRGYYAGAALGLDADDTDIGDGGLTDWTARLMSDGKERCLTSCVSTERLAALA